MKLENITIGTDPEEFIYDKTKGRCISAEGMIGGEKDAPLLVGDRGHAIQEDNIMTEYNIPPVMSADDFVREIKFIRDHIINEVLPYDMTLVSLPSASFTEKETYTDQSMTIGCEPDLNAYTQDYNPTIELMDNPQVRYCGGHIHIGSSTEMSFEDSVELIRCMDLFVGIPSMILDVDEARKQVYGGFGRFRITDYGVEYRSPSNWWLQDETTQRYIFNQTMKAVEHYNSLDGTDIDLEIVELLEENNLDELLKIFPIDETIITHVQSKQIKESIQESQVVI